MRPEDLRRLLMLAALWGGSFIFIRVAAPVLGPIMLVAARVTIAGIALLVFGAVRRQPLALRERWKQYLVLGALNSAAPFLLISAAEVRLTASMAAILNATTPLFGAIVAALWLKDPLTPKRVLGIFIAIGGVAVLVGWTPIELTPAVLLSIGASLLAACFYGVSGAYAKARMSGVPALGMAVGSQLGATVFLLPLCPFFPPATAPSSTVLFSVLALALIATTWAYILYFRLVADAGPARALSVTFLVPIFGVVWAAIFLREPITVSKVVGCGIILAGSWLVTGIDVRGMARRRGIVPAP